MVINVKVSKYNICENIFLITVYKAQVDFSLMAIKLCEKYEADGLLIFKNDPMEMLIYNKDGTEAMMCGNGMRAMVHYLYNRFRIYSHLKMKTKSGIYECEIVNKEPFISSLSFPFDDLEIKKHNILVNDKEFEINLIDVGVPHAIIISSDFAIDSKYILDIYNNELKNININLVKPLNSSVFEMLTYERGVGFTKSCGTGAIASAIYLHKYHNLESNLIVICPGGLLRVLVDDVITLTGESVLIEEYETEI